MTFGDTRSLYQLLQDMTQDRDEWRDEALDLHVAETVLQAKVVKLMSDIERISE